MSFSTTMQATASRLLTAYGEVVSVVRTNTLYLDPMTGLTVESAPTNYSGVGHTSLYTIQEIDNQTVLATDVKLLFYSATTPANGDVFTVNSVDATALSVVQQRAQGINIYYIVQLRQ